MSMEENTNIDVSVDTESLDDFADELFGQSKSQSEPASSEKSEDEPVTEDDAQTEDNTQVGEDDAPADEDEETSEVDTEVKPKKNRFQERIDELTSKAREAERKAAELEQRLAKFEKTNEPEPKTQEVVNTNTDGPSPDDKNEDGTEKYPLGEFDPKFAADVVRHTLRQEREAMLAQERENQARLKQEQETAVLQASWNEKLEPAKERYPDFIEKGQNLGSTFENIEPTYADYLTTTIMSMEYGPDVLYYLANNLDEATKIVQSGATKATIALGRLESKFAEAEETKQKARPKVSNAPTPPAHMNKGSAAAKAAVDPNTDDLDEFARALFNKKR